VKLFVLVNWLEFSSSKVLPSFLLLPSMPLLFVSISPSLSYVLITSCRKVLEQLLNHLLCPLHC
jgi:hypothetical protein